MLDGGHVLAVWARTPGAPAGLVAGVVAGNGFTAPVVSLSITGATATLVATGRWGDRIGVRVEVMVADGGTRPSAHAAGS